MSNADPSKAAPAVTVNKGTRSVAVDPDAPGDAAQSGTVVMRHNETRGTTVVPRSAFEGSYRYNGWEELTDADRESLFKEARDEGINIPEDAGLRQIVESVAAYRQSNREV